MKAFPSALRTVLTAIAKAEGTLDVLVEILAGTPIRRVLSQDQPVTWPPTTGDTYYPDTGEFSLVADTLSGQTPQVTLKLQNARSPEDASEKPWTTWLASNDPNGVEVVLRYVATLGGDSEAAEVERRWYLSGVNSLTHDAVVFHVGGPHDAGYAQVPRISLGGRKCWAAYRKGFCTSTSSLTTCGKSFAECTKRFPGGLVKRFGPGMPLFTDSRRRGVA